MSAPRRPWAVPFLVLALLVALEPDGARASTEINGLFDARSAGMGGTGVAFLASAGAIPTNPALLDQVLTLTVTLDAFLIVAQPTAPYTVRRLEEGGQVYENYETVRSEPTSAVLPFVGAAYRLLDRVVIGAAAYPVIGQGTSAEYYPAPDQFPDMVASNEAAMGLIEAAPALSVRLLDNLSVGATWRITHMIQSVSSPLRSTSTPSGLSTDTNFQPINAEVDITGTNFTGFQLGVFYKPVPSLGLGLSYRSKVVVDGTGTVTTRNPFPGSPDTVLDAESSFTNPHALRAGAALSVLSDTLLLAIDLKYLMYAEAFETTELTTINRATGERKTEVRPAHWRDALNVQLGAEYALSDMFRARAGYIMAMSATDPDYAVQLMAPPGISHLVSTGLGIRALESLDIDLAAAYVVLESRVTEATPHNSGVGLYGSRAVELSLSGNLHF